jgi:cytochrome c oxidase cbb3-type subunit 1
VYVIVLSVAGTVQGTAWATGDPFISSVEAAAPLWLGRAVSGSMMFVAHIVFAYNVWRMTIASPAPEERRPVEVPA